MVLRRSPPPMWAQKLSLLPYLRLSKRRESLTIGMVNTSEVLAYLAGIYAFVVKKSLKDLEIRFLLLHLPCQTIKFVFMKSTTNFSRSAAPALFCIFLRKNGAYNSFACNLGRHSFKPLHLYLSRETPALFLSSAFDWTDSSEGFRYWSDLNTKWLYAVLAFKL